MHVCLCVCTFRLLLSTQLLYLKLFAENLRPVGLGQIPKQVAQNLKNLLKQKKNKVIIKISSLIQYYDL